MLTIAKLDSIFSRTNPLAPETLAKYETFDDNRRKLTGVLASFWSWIRKSIEAAASLNNSGIVNIAWQKYVPILVTYDFEFIKCLHSLWNPATWEPLEPQLKILLGMTPSEKAVLLQIDVADNTTETKTGSNELVLKLWGWLARSREAW